MTVWYVRCAVRVLVLDYDVLLRLLGHLDFMLVNLQYSSAGSMYRLQ